MEPRWLSDAEQEAWRHLVAVLLRLPGALEQQLQGDAGLAHIEYLVLALLSEADDQRLQLSHLATQANASLSRLSHVVTRLERRGWVRRERDTEDARVTHAVLTEEGRATVVAAAPGHVAHVRDLVFDALDRSQVTALGEVSRAILAQLDPTATTPTAAPVQVVPTVHPTPVARDEVPAAAAADREPEGQGDPEAVDAPHRPGLGNGSASPGTGRHEMPDRGLEEPDPEVEVEGQAQLTLEGLGAAPWGTVGALSAPQRPEEDVEGGEVPRASWAAEATTHRVIRGRRWRTSDPRLPEPLRQRLVDELMDARRAVRDAPDADHERAARDRVHDAKVALGERGLRWWEAELDEEQLVERTRAAARALAATRSSATAPASAVDEVAAVVSRPTEEVRADLGAGADDG